MHSSPRSKNDNDQQQNAKKSSYANQVNSLLRELLWVEDYNAQLEIEIENVQKHNTTLGQALQEQAASLDIVEDLFSLGGNQ